MKILEADGLNIKVVNIFLFFLLYLFHITSLASENISTYPNPKINESNIVLVENGLKTAIQTNKTIRGMNILKRMNYYKVPAVSVAIINHNQVTWAKAYTISSEISVTPQTLFQAASISKSLTALMALSLVQNNKLQLDKNANDFLTTWKIPENNYTEKEKVTLRQLLSHTAGLNGPSHGFLGYSSSQEKNEIPTLVQILDGENPANSERIVVANIPGKTFSYSGGGYLIIQKMLEDITDTPFSQLANTLIFNPLNMKLSTFDLIYPNTDKERFAIGHLEDGRPVPGDWNLYPETAAAGLWTTPSELAQVVIEIQKSTMGKSAKILSSTMIKQMLTKQPNSPWGLGIKLNPINSSVLEFSSNGSNVGYIASFVGLTKTGQGAVIMTNSDNGMMIISEIIRSIADTYHWPDGYTDQYKIVNSQKQSVIKN